MGVGRSCIVAMLCAILMLPSMYMLFLWLEAGGGVAWGSMGWKGGGGGGGVMTLHQRAQRDLAAFLTVPRGLPKGFPKGFPMNPSHGEEEVPSSSSSLTKPWMKEPNMAGRGGADEAASASSLSSSSSSIGKQKEARWWEEEEGLLGLSTPRREEPADLEQEVERMFPDMAERNDVTFVFGLFNIGRKAHLGQEGLGFEEDYVEQLKFFLEYMEGEYIQVYMEERYYGAVAALVERENEEFCAGNTRERRPRCSGGAGGGSPLEGRVRVSFYEVEDLRGRFRFQERIEHIRTKTDWVKETGWLASQPQGYSDLYNPIVMQKISFLRRTALRNPFNTRYFAWLDCGGMCTPTMATYGLPYLKRKMMWWLRWDRFFITRSPYPMSGEIHGCHQRHLVQLTNGYEPQHVMKGWIMGGTLRAIQDLFPHYIRFLERSLDVGCLGTEETLFTMAYETHPALFNAFNNSEPWSWRADNCCKFFVEPPEDQAALEAAATDHLMTFGPLPSPSPTPPASEVGMKNMRIPRHGW